MSACSSLLLRRWPSALGDADRLAATCAAGLLVLAPFAAVELSHTGALPAAAWGWMLLAGLLPGLASYLAYGYVQAQLGVTRASLMLYLAPVYGALLAWVFLGEPPHGYHLLGAALILPGIRFAAPRPPPRTA